MDILLKQVQTKLIELGYDLGPAGADGESGRYTTQAIEKFQKDKRLKIQYPGTLGPITLGALKINPQLEMAGNPSKIQPSLGIVPPWVADARKRVGLQESRDNKKLSEFLKSDGRFLGDPAKNPWCGDFADTIIARNLPKEPLLSNPYWALNWEKFGVAVPKGIVPLGALCPVVRPGGGHITVIVGHDKTYYHGLGGNQSNGITITKILKTRNTHGLRWPKTYPLPTMKDNLPYTTIAASVSHNEA